MTGFLYYFPGGEQVTDERLIALGLAHVAGRPYTSRGTSAGPDGGNGVLVWQGDESQTYRPELQSWTECAGFWLGHYTESPPGPDDLLRSDPINGYHCELADGRRWLVPTPEMQEGGAMLPQAVRMDAQGKPHLEALPRYATLAEYAQEVFRAFTEADEKDWEWSFTACVEALATNYRVSRWEVGALGLLSTGHVMQMVLAALSDWIGYLHMRSAQEEAAKKNESVSTPGTCATSNGEGG